MPTIPGWVAEFIFFIKSRAFRFLQITVVKNVENWDTTPVFVKATRGLSQRGGLQFAIPLFSHYSNKPLIPSVANFLNRSYARFAPTTTTRLITANNPVKSNKCKSRIFRVFILSQKFKIYEIICF